MISIGQRKKLVNIFTNRYYDLTHFSVAGHHVTGFSQNDLRVKLFTTTAFVCSCIFQIIRPEI